MAEEQRAASKWQDIDELTDLVGYQLHLTHLIALREARSALDGRQLTPAKVTALLFIRNNPGCAQSALARFLTINRSSAMKLVDILVERNFIRRGEGKDLRSNGLYLTARGTASLKAAIALLQEEDRMLNSALSANERRELLRLLRKVRDTVGSEDLDVVNE